MANEPFSRTIVNPLERPVSDDIDQLQSTLDYALRYWLNAATAHRTHSTVPMAMPMPSLNGSPDGTPQSVTATLDPPSWLSGNGEAPGPDSAD